MGKAIHNISTFLTQYAYTHYLHQVKSQREISFLKTFKCILLVRSSPNPHFFFNQANSAQWILKYTHIVSSFNPDIPAL